jgi:hypothetical protein
MSLRIRLSPLFFALWAGVANAQTPTAVTFVPAGETIPLSPGHTQREPIAIGITGVLLLTAPGTYTASSWAINGEVRLGGVGHYTVVSSTGSIVVSRTGSVKGPEFTGGFSKRLVFAHAGEFSFAATSVDPTVDIVQGVPPVLDAPPLVNISTRATLSAGQIHTSGFVVGGKVARSVLIRAIGPTLANFGVSNPLPSPTLTLFSRQFSISSNSGWGGDPFLEATFSAVGAFSLPKTSRDAALVTSLIPGAYTVQVAGGAGEVLVEIYFLE